MLHWRHPGAGRRASLLRPDVGNLRVQRSPHPSSDLRNAPIRTQLQSEYLYRCSGFISPFVVTEISVARKEHEIVSALAKPNISYDQIHRLSPT